MELFQDIEALFTVQTLVSLLTLTFLEIILGIDNIIFISIIAGQLPEKDQGKARTFGLTLALLIRIALLFSISWLVSMKEPLFTIAEFDATGRDLILLAGGIFLLAKTTTEIHKNVEGEDEISPSKKVKNNILYMAILQIILIDVVFSFDSILTAIGLVSNVLIMVVAVIIAMVIMLIFSASVAKFVNQHPTVKVLALSFLLMIAIILIMDGLHFHVPKEYIYFSIAFSFFVEMLNLRMKKNKKKE